MNRQITNQLIDALSNVIQSGLGRSVEAHTALVELVKLTKHIQAQKDFMATGVSNAIINAICLPEESEKIPGTELSVINGGKSA